MRRCEDEKMRYSPPLLEEPCAQALSGMKRNWKYKCMLRHLCVPEWCPPLRQFRLTSLSITCDNDGPNQNKHWKYYCTCTSLSRHQNKVEKTLSKMQLNRTDAHANHISTNVSESVASLQPQRKCLPCLANWQTWTASMKSQVSVIFWYCFHGVSVRVSVYHIFCSRV